jgi:hypothetical protein
VVKNTIKITRSDKMKKALLASVGAIVLMLASQTAATASVNKDVHNPSSLAHSLASKPRDHHGSSGNTRIVRFKFVGRVASYQPYSGSSGTNGSITVTVSGSNLDHQSVKGMVMTFGITSQTSVINNGPTPTTGEKVKVFVMAPKDTVFAGSSGSSGTTAASNLSAVKIIFSNGDGGNGNNGSSGTTGKGDHHGSSGNTRIVRFKFVGRVASYQPYSGSSGTNGSITVTVSGSNLDHQSVKGMVMTFGITSQTSVINNGPTPTTGEKVKVFVMAPKDTVFAGSSGSSGTTAASNLSAVKIIFSNGDGGNGNNGSSGTTGKGDHHGSSGNTRIVRFKFVGRVASYQPYSGSSGTNGSITVTVSGSNLDHQSVKGMVMTFGITSQTSVINNGPTPTTGEKVKVFVMAPKDTVFAGSSGSSGTTAASNLSAVKIIFSNGN